MVSGWENIIRASGNLTKGEGRGSEAGPRLGDADAPCQTGLAVEGGR